MFAGEETSEDRVQRTGPAEFVERHAVLGLGRQRETPDHQLRHDLPGPLQVPTHLI